MVSRNKDKDKDNDPSEENVNEPECRNSNLSKSRLSFGTQLKY